MIILRTIRGWNQDDLARASGIRNSAVSDYERGRKLPGLAIIDRLLAAMGFPLAAVDHTRQYVEAMRTHSYTIAARTNPGPEDAPPPVRRAAQEWEIEQASAELGNALRRKTRLELYLLLHGPAGDRGRREE